MLAAIGYGIADVAVRLLPVTVANGLAKACARAAFALRLPARGRLESNLALLMSGGGRAPHAGSASRRGAPGRCPPEVRHKARQAFEHFALSLTDFLRLGYMPREALSGSIDVRGEEHLAAAQASGRGVIVLSAHVGNWEWGAAYLASLGERVHVAARSHPSPWVEALFTRRRCGWGVSRLCGRPLWLEASRVLRRREWVAIMGDRPGPDLGGSVCAWAGALSRRTGAWVLPAVMLRLANGRYLACFEPPLRPVGHPGGGHREALVRCLKWDPAQWFAFEPMPEGLA